MNRGREQVSVSATISMPAAAGSYQVIDNYYVEREEGDHLVLTAGAEIGRPGFGFDDAEKVAAMRDSGWEVKHYHSNGRKSWTEHAGREFFFVIPRKRIRLVCEKGYSYVPVQIGGKRLTLNVSGGTYPKGRWTDTVHRIADTSIGMPVGMLRHLAAHAWSVAECRERGVTLTLRRLEDYRLAGFERVAARFDGLRSLKAGQVLHLSCNYSFEGKRGPFAIAELRPKNRSFVCESGGYRLLRVPYKHVDWVETLKANGMPVRQSESVNRIPAPEAAQVELTA